MECGLQGRSCRPLLSDAARNSNVSTCCHSLPGQGLEFSFFFFFPVQVAFDCKKSLWYARVSFHLREQQVQIEECFGQDEIFQKALLEDLRLHFCNPYTSYTDNTMKREDLDEDECCTDLDKLEQRPVVWIRLSKIPKP